VDSFFFVFFKSVQLLAMSFRLAMFNICSLLLVMHDFMGRALPLNPDEIKIRFHPDEILNSNFMGQAPMKY
jgi:hypothetical protein